MEIMKYQNFPIGRGLSNFITTISNIGELDIAGEGQARG